MGDAAAVRELLRAAFAGDGPAGLRRLQRLLALLTAGRGGAAVLVQAQRLAHSLKGAGALLGADELEAAAHAVEDRLHAWVPDRPPGDAEVRRLRRALVPLRYAVLDEALRGAVAPPVPVHLGSLEKALAQAVGRWSRLRRRPARLLLHGGRTLVEPALLGTVRDGLAQLLRNALEHGIEPPARRRAAGKPAQGCIEVRARRQAGQLVLCVRDDGRGLDLERIAQVARARGLLQGSATPGLRQAAALVLQPGFSTRTRAGIGAGRGMGLDVVRALVQRAGGTLRLQARRGQGLRVELRLTPP